MSPTEQYTTVQSLVVVTHLKCKSGSGQKLPASKQTKNVPVLASSSRKRKGAVPHILENKRTLEGCRSWKHYNCDGGLRSACL